MKALKKHWYWLLFVAAALLTVYMDVYVANNLLDGDFSDYLYWAKTIAEEKNPFTSSYYFSTELRLLDISFVFSLFFLLSDNWILVQILGTFCMQCLYVLAFLFMAKQAKLSLYARFTAAALLLLPFSTAYGRIVLYQLHYTLYLTNAFLIVGLTLRLVQILPEKAKKHKRGGGARLSAALLTLLWIFVGLNGVRHMLIIGAPMLLFAFIALIQAMNDCGWAARTPWRQQALWHTDAVRLVWIMLGSCLCFLTGYILNQQVLAPYYQLVWSPVLNVTPTLAPEKFTKVLIMWLMAIGARRTEEPLVSMRGVALGAALFPAVYCLICSLGKWREKALGKAMLQSLLGLSMLISTCLFLLEGTTRYYELYYVPVLALTFPLLAVALDKLPAQKLGQRALTVIACLCLVFGSGYTAKFMLTKDETMDGWSGLNFGNMNVVEELRDCVEFMQEEEYTHAVIDYWYANPMMELSNGELTVAPMELTFAENEAQEDTLSISPWGTSKTAFRPENLPDTVLVFLRWENELPTFLERFPDAVLVWESAPFSTCEIDKELLTY